MHLTNKELIRSDALVASGCPDEAGAPGKRNRNHARNVGAEIDALEDWRYEKIRFTGRNREKMLVERIYLAMASCQQQAC